ncbi:MAG TPA: ATP-binding protein [Blastocatellia bacterium]|nr:ATP-binding protein [Blastocatellia bacterium]
MVQVRNHSKTTRKAGQPDIAMTNFTPRPHWSDMGDSDHFVQFYETDWFLMNSVSEFIGKGLGAGEAGIVVATKAHLDGLEERLHAGGLDVAAARAAGRYVSLDAAETLSRFMIDGSPEPGRFAEGIGGIIARAAEGQRPVRIFGEMVALLWADSNPDAAIRLEALWNDLRKTRPFSLFCAYPMNSFNGHAHSELFSGVCAEHSQVIPAESYVTIADPDDRLRAIVLLQQKAESLEAEIAERKKAEEALRAVKDELEVQLKERDQLLVSEQMARAEAQTANRMKDEFLATVSHELRTPLNAIIGWCHMLRKGGLDKNTAARALETIERNAKSQAQLVEDILDVSRVITGKLRLNIGPVDVAAVINSAIDCVQLAADSKGIRLEVSLDPSARRISGDSSRLQQVVWNLLANAIKFTPSGGRVEVRLERAGPDAQIRVSDTGCGISPDFLPFIFDRFRQADGASTRRHGGLGLGLAIVRHLVELHGGTVFVESSGEGRGATFSIRLPLAPIQVRQASRRMNADSLRANESNGAYLKPLPSLVGMQVLIVDDDQDTINMLTVTLSEYGAEVQTAASVAEAIGVLEWYMPDVLVSDLAMPDEDGYSLLGKVRALESAGGKRIPAIALTAYVRVEDRARALSAGFNMFVPKPLEPNELITAIANLAEHGADDCAQEVV